MVALTPEHREGGDLGSGRPDTLKGRKGPLAQKLQAATQAGPSPMRPSTSLFPGVSPSLSRRDPLSQIHLQVFFHMEIPDPLQNHTHWITISGGRAWESAF